MRLVQTTMVTHSASPCCSQDSPSLTWSLHSEMTLVFPTLPMVTSLLTLWRHLTPECIKLRQEPGCRILQSVTYGEEFIIFRDS